MQARLKELRRHEFGRVFIPGAQAYDFYYLFSIMDAGSESWVDQISWAISCLDTSSSTSKRL